MLCLNAVGISSDCAREDVKVKVLVMIENAVINERIFKTKSGAIRFASKKKSQGYRVRLINL